MLICDLQFASDAPMKMEERLRRFDLSEQSNGSRGYCMAALKDLRGTPVDYIERTLKEIVTALDLPWNTVRSSSLNLPPALRGQERIIAIARHFGAARYLNAPGGRSLYDQQRFADAGIELCFLPEYDGPSTSVLGRLLMEDPASLVAGMRSSCR